MTEHNTHSSDSAETNEDAADPIAESFRGNREAAKYRTQLRTTEAERDALAERVAKYEAAEQAAEKAAELDNIKAELAKAHSLPAHALRGETREDLEAHAEVLMKVIPHAPIVPGQGISPDMPDFSSGFSSAFKPKNSAD